MEMVSKFYDKLLARQSLSSWFCVILGSVILSAGFVLFMNPYRVVPGGVYGTGIVLHALVPSVQVGTFGLMLDIPLLLIGLKVFGRMFGVKTVCSALLIPVVMNGMTYLIGENPATMFGGNMNLSQDMFLVCIFGGVFLGCGTGLIIKGHATSGGTDIIAMLLTRYTRMRFSRAILLVDSCIIVCRRGSSTTSSTAPATTSCFSSYPTVRTKSGNSSSTRWTGEEPISSPPACIPLSSAT